MEALSLSILAGLVSGLFAMLGNVAYETILHRGTRRYVDVKANETLLEALAGREAILAAHRASFVEVEALFDGLRSRVDALFEDEASRREADIRAQAKAQIEQARVELEARLEEAGAALEAEKTALMAQAEEVARAAEMSRRGAKGAEARAMQAANRDALYVEIEQRFGSPASALAKQHFAETVDFIAKYAGSKPAELMKSKMLAQLEGGSPPPVGIKSQSSGRVEVAPY